MSYLNNSTHDTPYSKNSSTMKDDLEERQQLERANFDLKMKIYFLEESLKRTHDHERGIELQTDRSRLEISNMKLLLEEKQIELDQRNLLLMKSKNAIESLKKENELLVQQRDDFIGKLNQLEKFKVLYSESEDDYNNQIKTLELDNMSIKRLLHAKESERSTMEALLTQRNEQIKRLEAERDQLQEQFVKTQHNMSLIIEELTQAKAHVDLYQLQTQEYITQKDQIKEKLKEAVHNYNKLDGESRKHVGDISSQYENQIQQIRDNHEKELEKLRAGHINMLSDLRENYQHQLDQQKNLIEKTLHEHNQQESKEISRVKEDFSDRLKEKMTEIQMLRNQMDSDRIRDRTVLQELEASRLDIRQKVIIIDELTSKLQIKTEENKKNEYLRLEYEVSKKSCIELSKQLKNEINEKNSFLQQFEKLSSQFNNQQHINNEKDNIIKNLTNNVNKLENDTLILSNKVESIEKISRENEKLKSSCHSLQFEFKELSSKYSELNGQFNQISEENFRLKSELNNLQHELSEIQIRCSHVTSQKEELQITAQNFQKLLSTSESSLQEQKLLLIESKNELEKEISYKLSSENSLKLYRKEMDDMQKTVGKCLSISYSAIIRWDELLSKVLDGEIFAEIRSNFNNNKNNNSNNNNLQINREYSPLTKHQSNHLLHTHNNHHTTYNNYDNLDENDDLLTLSPDALLQRVSISIERVHIKVERTKKIRQLFDSQSKKLFTSSQEDIVHVNDKLALLQHRLEDLSSNYKLTKSIIDKDHKHREKELQELSSFRDVIVGEHSAQLRDSEIRLATSQKLIEEIKQINDNLRRDNDFIRLENESLKKNIQDLKEDIKQYNQTEEILSQLAMKTNSLIDSNQALSSENKSTKESNMMLSQENKELKVLHSSFVSEIKNLSQDIVKRDTVIEEYELKLQKFSSEIDRLRTRQINPELAKTIMDTQNTLQYVSRLSTPSSHRPSYHNQYNGNNNINNELIFSDNHMKILVELTVVTSETSNRCLDIVNRFESIHQQVVAFRSQLINDSNVRSNQDIQSDILELAYLNSTLENDLYDLLDSNAKNSLNLNQLVAEMKRTIRKYESNSYYQHQNTSTYNGNTTHHEDSFHQQEIPSPDSLEKHKPVLNAITLNTNTSRGRSVSAGIAQRKSNRYSSTSDIDSILLIDQQDKINVTPNAFHFPSRRGIMSSNQSNNEVDPNNITNIDEIKDKISDPINGHTRSFSNGTAFDVTNVINSSKLYSNNNNSNNDNNNSYNYNSNNNSRIIPSYRDSTPIRYHEMDSYNFIPTSSHTSSTVRGLPTHNQSYHRDQQDDLSYTTTASRSDINSKNSTTRGLPPTKISFTTDQSFHQSSPLVSKITNSSKNSPAHSKQYYDNSINQIQNNIQSGESHSLIEGDIPRYVPLSSIRNNTPINNKPSESVPNQPSMSRLTKLGMDLQSLAKKLDEFDNNYYNTNNTNNNTNNINKTTVN
eukprot:gene4415-6242_t